MSLIYWWNKLCRDNISEPIVTLVKLFKENSKRFKFTYKIELNDECYYNHDVYAYCYVEVTDQFVKESWKFNLNLSWDALRDITHEYRSQYIRHKVYPILGYELTVRPNWITEEEVEYVAKVLAPYFLGRVGRYRELVNYRQERKEESHKRKTELDKKKERQRLIDIYKGK